MENKLPKDWKIVELKEVVSLLGDGLHGTPKYTNESDYYFINGNNLGNGKITIKENTKKVSKEEFEKYKKLLNDKTVLVSINGTLGNVAFYNNEKVILGKSACYFNVLDCLDKKYIKILLSGLEFLNYAHKSATGSTIPNVSLKTMREFKFPLPPLETQQTIVSKLEELFSELDKGIEDLKTAQQQLKTYRQSVLKWAFEGKLTNEKVKEGELPEGWEMIPINTVSSINPKLPNKENLDREMEVQFLPMKLVEEIVNKIHLSDIKKLHEVLKGSYTPFIDNDIIFAKVTPCMENGKIAVVEKLKNGIGFGSSEFHVVRTNEKVNNKFMFYFLVQDRFRNEAANAMTGAVGLRRVPKQFIENYQIPIPSTEEQHQIVQEIESRLSVADKMEESIAQSLQQAEALRQSILKKAFSGELV
jgi:type I restriction enzyme S subunit